jgi:hypothetical protein
VLRYKASEPGEFVWRDIVAVPTWFPPKSTPDRELVRRGANGRWEAREDVIGPGYRSAYGLAMAMHVRHVPALGKRPEKWIDEGVRTHGTSSYLSMYGDHSHGCHRLPNHLALRLASFLVRDRPHDILGPLVEHYHRRIAWGRVFHVRRHSRGFGYRLAEPVRVTVLEGTILGTRTSPPRGNWPLPPRRQRTR